MSLLCSSSITQLPLLCQPLTLPAPRPCRPKKELHTLWMSVLSILGYGMTYLNRFSKTKSSEARLPTTYSVTLSFMFPKWDKNIY